MGSPYSVSVSSRVHVIRSLRGYINLRKDILRSCSCYDDARLGSGPVGAMIFNFDAATHNAILQSRRAVIILEARYEWDGFEKFNRIVVLDFSRSKGKTSLESLYHPIYDFYAFHVLRLRNCEKGDDFKLVSGCLEEIPLI